MQQGYGRLKGKVAVVTGGSRGIGFAIARGFAREGADVVIVSRNEEQVAAAGEEIRRLGGQVLALRVDVANPEDVERMAKSTEDRFGRLDILVNNAGIQIRGPSEEMAFESWKAVIDVHLTGAFLCAQAAGRMMLRQKSGSIINIASLSSYVGMPERVPYSSAKTGIVGLTRVLATEWARRGIRVNAIAPGYILSEMTKKAMAQGMIDEKGIVARTPMGRFGTPEDLVGPAIFLASDEAAFVTGQVLPVDGGFLAFGYIKPGEGDY
ncbi:MAG: SDR family NAD(P)-dependent oxidoreductase [Chloroflexota bacterium]